MLFDQTLFFDRVDRLTAVVKVLQFLGDAISDGDADAVPGLSESACRLLAGVVADRCSDLLAVFHEDGDSSGGS